MSSSQNDLRDFFAVTGSVDGSSISIYKVSIERTEYNEPTVCKVASRGNSSITVNGLLRYGQYVGLTDEWGINLYNSPRGEGRVSRPSDISTKNFGGHSSPIVALFLDLGRAEECFNSTDIQLWDERWREETNRTLIAISDEHPIFILGRGLANRLHSLIAKGIKDAPPDDGY